MEISKQINMACVYAGISQSELARRIGTSPQALNNRLKTGKFTREELDKIAQALGCTLVLAFVFDDGTKV